MKKQITAKEFSEQWYQGYSGDNIDSLERRLASQINDSFVPKTPKTGEYKVLEDYLKNNSVTIHISKNEDGIIIWDELYTEIQINDENYDSLIGSGLTYDKISTPFEITASTIKEGLLQLSQNIEVQK